MTSTSATDGPKDAPLPDATARLRVELWAARDAAIGAEVAAGQLRGRVKALEAELDDRQRHVQALLREVAALRDRVQALELVQANRDAILRSPTWRIGVLVMRPLQLVRRRRT
jgi:hypothetical protein